MRTITINWQHSYLLKKAIKNQMQQYWHENILMADAGYGKDFWANNIDRLADYLSEIEAQEH